MLTVSLALFLSATDAGAPSVSEALLTLLNSEPRRRVLAQTQWKMNASSTAVLVDSTICDVTLEATRCRSSAPEEDESWAYGGTHSIPDAGTTEAPPKASALIDAIRAQPPRTSVLIRELPGLGVRAVVERDPTGSRLLLELGGRWLMSEPLMTSAVGAIEVDAFPIFDASAVFQTRTWGVVLVDGDQGNGNNASGAYSYFAAFFREEGDRLSLIATHPLGHTSFWRSVTDEGFRMGNSHALLCPSVEGKTLRTAPACQGSGEPRSFTPPFAVLCAQARKGPCTFSKQQPDELSVRRGAGTFVARGSILVRADAAKRVRELSVLKAGELFVSERPFESQTPEPLEWMELQNTTAQWVDLNGLELRTEKTTARLDAPCVIAPHGVVVLQRGNGPSRNAHFTECRFGDVTLEKAITLLAGEVELAVTYPNQLPTWSLSVQCDAKGARCELRPRTPGVSSRAP